MMNWCISKFRYMNVTLGGFILANVYSLYVLFISSNTYRSKYVTSGKDGLWSYDKYSIGSSMASAFMFVRPLLNKHELKHVFWLVDSNKAPYLGLSWLKLESPRRRNSCSLYTKSKAIIGVCFMYICQMDRNYYGSFLGFVVI